MEGKINGKRGRERPRDSNLRNIKKLLSLPSYEVVNRLAGKKEEWLKRQGKALGNKKKCLSLILYDSKTP